ncbi:hypothetical protein ACFQE2_07375 [Methylophaga thalassica]
MCQSKSDQPVYVESVLEQKLKLLFTASFFYRHQCRAGFDTDYCSTPGDVTVDLLELVRGVGDCFDLTMYFVGVLA